MRRIVMFNNVDAGGSFSDAEGDLSWTTQEPRIMEDAAESTAGYDTILFGRRTYEMFASFWPHVTRGSPNPHGPGPLPEPMLAMADMLNASRKIVFSKTLSRAEWRNSELRRALDPKDVEALKRAPGKDIIVFGSGSIVAQLARHGLVDEFQLVVNPVLVAGGRPLFGALDETTTLRLLGAKGYPSGVAMLRYAPA